MWLWQSYREEPPSQIIDVLTLDLEISSSKENRSNFILFPNLRPDRARQNPALSEAQHLNMDFLVLTSVISRGPSKCSGPQFPLLQNGSDNRFNRVIANDLYFAWNRPSI